MNKEKKYFESTKTIYMNCSPEWMKWMEKAIESGREDWMKNSLLLKENVQDFKKLFGKQSFCTQDSSCRRLYVWKKTLPSGYIWLMTAGNGRGTSYEVSEGTEWKHIQVFLDNLKTKLVE